MANSVGSKLNLCSDDFNSSNPINKLEIICKELDIIPDWNKGYWAAIWWLANFRNKIAHAGPQPLLVFDKTVSAEKFNHSFHEEMPSSDLENEMTLGNARRAVNAVTELKWGFLSKDKCKQFSSLYSDGFSGKASAIG